MLFKYHTIHEKRLAQLIMFHMGAIGLRRKRDGCLATGGAASATSLWSIPPLQKPRSQNASCLIWTVFISRDWHAWYSKDMLGAQGTLKKRKKSWYGFQETSTIVAGRGTRWAGMCSGYGFFVAIVLMGIRGTVGFFWAMKFISGNFQALRKWDYQKMTWQRKISRYQVGDILLHHTAPKPSESCECRHYHIQGPSWCLNTSSCEAAGSRDKWQLSCL